MIKIYIKNRMNNFFFISDDSNVRTGGQSVN